MLIRLSNRGILNQHREVCLSRVQKKATVFRCLIDTVYQTSFGIFSTCFEVSLS